MNQLKYIRTQDQGGTYGEKIPLAVDSEQVSMENGDTLESSFNNLEAIIETKVTKQTGKDLSSNDYTDEDKSKLDSIARNANYIQIDTTLSQRNSAADSKAVGDALVELRSMVSSPPLVAKTAASMINPKKIYVYTGTEDEYKYGYWYYYEDSQWKAGGPYNQITIQDQLRTLIQTRIDTLTDQTTVAIEKADNAQNGLNLLEPRVSVLQEQIPNFPNEGEFDSNTSTLYFKNNGNTVFRILGVSGGGGGSGGGGDEGLSQQYSIISKEWAVGPNGTVGNPTDTNNSKYWSTQSASFAHGGTNTRTGENTDNAEYWKNKSKEWAIGTADTESLPSNSNNAKYWSDQANAYGLYWNSALETKESQLEQDLNSHGNNIKDQFSTVAESYLHGGTGTRQNEDTDNIQYYNNRAKSWAVGPTSSSTPSNSNNARYWSEQALSYYNSISNIVADYSVNRIVPLIDLDTSAEPETEDNILYSAIVTLGWDDSVII